jgi:hypothetical protein
MLDLEPIFVIIRWNLLLKELHLHLCLLCGRLLKWGHIVEDTLIGGEGGLRRVSHGRVAILLLLAKDPNILPGGFVSQEYSFNDFRIIIERRIVKGRPVKFVSDVRVTICRSQKLQSIQVTIGSRV